MVVGRILKLENKTKPKTRQYYKINVPEVYICFGNFVPGKIFITKMLMNKLGKYTLS